MANTISMDQEDWIWRLFASLSTRPAKSWVQWLPAVQNVRLMLQFVSSESSAEHLADDAKNQMNLVKSDGHTV